MQHPNVGMLSIAFLAVLAACTPERETPREGPTAAAPHVVRLTATEYSLEVPDTVPAGWATLRLTNLGQEVHYGHMVRLDSGKTVRDLVDAYAEAIRTSGPRPNWARRFGGPGGTGPGDSASVTQYLEPGAYVWICPVEDETGSPHFAKGEFEPFVVGAAEAGAAGRAAEPEAGMVLRLTDYSFVFDSPPVAGRHTVRVENAGGVPHDLVMMKLAPGKTLADVQAWMNPERARRPDQAAEPPPPLEEIGAMAGGIAAIAPGMESWIETAFTPGEYVLLCMATAPDGRSHIEHGMARQVTIR
jgi:hypothetical protein